MKNYKELIEEYMNNPEIYELYGARAYSQIAIRDELERCFEYVTKRLKDPEKMSVKNRLEVLEKQMTEFKLEKMNS